VRINHLFVLPGVAEHPYYNDYQSDDYRKAQDSVESAGENANGTGNQFGNQHHGGNGQDGNKNDRQKLLHFHGGYLLFNKLNKAHSYNKHPRPMAGIPAIGHFGVKSWDPALTGQYKNTREEHFLSRAAFRTGDE